MKKQKLPLGVSDFRMLQESNRYYVDKSLLAEELMESSNPVIILPRPRRFGKTLTLSMLRYFFDCIRPVADDGGPGSYAPLFDGLAITDTDTWKDHMGKYPVIFLSLKDCKGADWALMQEKLAVALHDMCTPHRYLLTSVVWEDAADRDKLEALLAEKASRSVMESSIRLLAAALYQYHGQAPVVLIDEYDTP